MVSSMNRPWLKDGVTIVIRGQGLLSGMHSGSRMLSSVQGQPVLPSGGVGSSLNDGQRTGLFLDQKNGTTVTVAEAALKLALWSFSS